METKNFGTKTSVSFLEYLTYEFFGGLNEIAAKKEEITYINSLRDITIITLAALNIKIGNSLYKTLHRLGVVNEPAAEFLSSFLQSLQIKIISLHKQYISETQTASSPPKIRHLH